MREMVQRRAASEPVAYIVGHREFWGLELAVSPAVLIPRPETELIVEQALTRHNRVGPLRIADVGTGSGCIAIALAHELPSARVVAIDCSTPYGDMRIIQPLVPSIRTSFISDKSSNQIPKNHVSYLPFMAVDISL